MLYYNTIIKGKGFIFEDRLLEFVENLMFCKCSKYLSVTKAMAFLRRNSSLLLKLSYMLK